MMKHTAIIAICALLFSIQSCAAEMNMSGMQHDSAAVVGATAEANGVVKSLDAAKGVVTITHEPIKSLGWSAMTMDFTVKDKALFKKLATGKKVHFMFKEEGESYLITAVK